MDRRGPVDVVVPGHDDELLGTAAIAAELGIQPGTLLASLHRGLSVPPPSGQVGGKLYWHERDFERWKANEIQVSRRRPAAQGDWPGVGFP
jgi:hypothetical protein